MAAINSRRKAITYGKHRKPTTSFSPAAADTFSRIAFADEPRGIDSFDIPLKHTKQPLKGASPGSKRSTSLECGYRLKCVPTVPLGPTGQSANSPSEEDEAIFDISSSGEDECEQPSPVQGVTGKKRRKLAPGISSNTGAFSTIDGGARDRGNQSDFAKSFDRDHPKKVQAVSKFQTASNAGKHPYLKDPKGPDATAGSGDMKSANDPPNKLIGIARKGPVDSENKPLVLSKLPTKRDLTTNQLTGNPELVPPDLSNEPDPVSKHRKRMRSNQVLPKTPPKRPVSTDHAITPRQRGLWKMLLPGNDSGDSQGRLDLPNLNLDDRRSESNAETNQQKSEDVSRPKSGLSYVNRRPKLVDTLQCQDIASDSEDTSLDNSPTSSDELNGEERSLAVVRGAKADPDYGSQRSAGYGETHTSSTQSQDQRLYSNSQPMPLLPGVAQKSTYARQRSYIREADLIEIGTFDLPILNDSATERRLRRGTTQTQRRRLLHGQSLVDESNGEKQESQGPALRSIHELRRAGGNSRLVSEIESMIDDISDVNFTVLSLRRTRLLELATRLQGSSYKQVFVDHGFETRLLSRMESCSDSIEQMLISAVVLQLLAGSVSTQLLSQMSSSIVVCFLIGLLDMDQDMISVSKACNFKISKLAHAELRQFCASLLISDIWSAGKPRRITSRVIALQTLERLIRQSREAGSVDNLLPDRAISRIARFLEIQPSTETLNSGPSLELQLAVSILESSTIGNNETRGSNVWSRDTLEPILSLLPSFDTQFTDTPETLRSLTLRLYLNLTNNNTELCIAFSRQDVLRSIFDMMISGFGKMNGDVVTHPLVLDSLILSLGSLINLAEWSQEVRQSTMDLHLAGTSYLDLFLQLFVSRSKDAAEVYSEAETSTNVAFGYLSVLISYLCIDDEVMTHVRCRLAGKSIKSLLNAVKEFLHYHRKIDGEIIPCEGEVDLKASFTTRLQGIVDILEERQ